MNPGLTRSAKLALIALAGAWLAACASHPRPMGPVAPMPPPPPPPPPSQSYAAPTPPPVEQGQAGAPVPGSERDFVINVGDRVYFDFDKYDIRDDARPVLDSQAGWLSRYPAVQVRIEGNCDELGTREYNFALGARRANSVKEYLEQHGIAAARIATVSYGKEHPVDLGEGDDARAHNRNAHTAITAGGA
ncbi:MAG TPA: peptidoglycan-associated lipoprotein Pal [Caulobacteraceae bacterium]|jgi:peptidoglycan-associated lipoprotein